MKTYFKLHPLGFTDSSYAPTTVAKVYNFPQANGAGQTIGIIELGGGYRQSDMQAFFNQLGIPMPNIIPISVDGAKNAPGSDSDVEVVLDIQIAAAVAPGATIKVYFAQNTNASFVNAVRAAVNDKVNAISISWGAPEDQWDSNSIQQMNAAFQAAKAANINVFVASGDSGSSDGESGTHVDFPASSPYVIGCGGTTLQATATNRISEIAWTGSGGGFSSLFSINGKPRGVPDVAGNADPNTGYTIFMNGQQQSVGGTSAVAPLFAGLCALINQAASAKNLSTVLYSNPSCFFDVVQGSNGKYSATTGWDAVTGLGVPNGNLLLEAISPEPPPVPQPPVPPVPQPPVPQPPVPQPPVPQPPVPPEPSPVYLQIIQFLISQFGPDLVSIIVSLLTGNPMPSNVKVSPTNLVLIKTLIKEFGQNLVPIIIKLLPVPPAPPSPEPPVPPAPPSPEPPVPPAPPSPEPPVPPAPPAPPVPPAPPSPEPPVATEPTKLLKDVLTVLANDLGQLLPLVQMLLAGNTPTIDPTALVILQYLVKQYGVNAVDIVNNLPPSIIEGTT